MPKRSAARSPPHCRSTTAGICARGLARSVREVVAAHGRCWAAAGPKRQTLTRETTTLERWHAVHDLLDQGVGLLDCARRLGLALNTVKRYARASEPDQLRRPPYYRACLVAPFPRPLAAASHRTARCPGPSRVPRDQSARLHRRPEPAAQIPQPGRAESDRICPSPRRLTSWIMSRPTDLPARRRAHLDELVRACPEITDLARLVGEFAAILIEPRGGDLGEWMKQVREAGLTELGPFPSRPRPGPRRRGRRPDRALQQRPDRRRQHQTKLIKRQMYGRASFSHFGTASRSHSPGTHRKCARAVVPTVPCDF